jgi:hypothetical protein
MGFASLCIPLAFAHDQLMDSQSDLTAMSLQILEFDGQVLLGISYLEWYDQEFVQPAAFFILACPNAYIARRCQEFHWCIHSVSPPFLKSIISSLPRAVPAMRPALCQPLRHRQSVVAQARSMCGATSALSAAARDAD